ncbi:MAG: peptidoglycan DD-metalloendopeptidase family protein [Bacteroidales bacterium]|nr:peptidoglycan DD-metalloendopeptidase family protein [Bacteroidales bacterium]
MTRKILDILLVFCCLTFALLPYGCGRKAQPETEEDTPAVLPPEGFMTDSLDMREDSVHEGETFTAMMTRLGMEKGAAMNLALVCDTVFDVRKMRAGSALRIYRSSDSTLRYMVYERDKIHRTVFKTSDSLAVWNYSRPVETAVRFADVTISSSLWNDMSAAGAPTLLIVSLADIYAWSVDFFALQEGDRFRVLYDETSCEGEVIGVDPVRYAEFISGNTVIPAILYDQGDGGNRYWKEDGESLRKAFLKAPLKFTRVSSGFSYRRKHPVTGKVRPHTAVDYAAPSGTPVMTIGDGTVVSAGWTNGGGKTVKIRHNSSYMTSYMHLSRYAKGIRDGAHVRQGDVIGYVGATGVATGPHLDFRVWKDGTPVNPLKLVSPSADPILPSNLPALDSTHRVYKHLIDSLSTR